MSTEQTPDGLILLNKQPGITSFDALRDIKRSFGTGKVGHTGTLDKFAQGLLLVLCGKALKLSAWFSGCDKQYEALVVFGTETDTLDPEGNIVASADLPSLNQIENILPQFRGAIMQAPPEYSAIHINGRRASELARSGSPPEMIKRPVNIYKIALLDWTPPYARFFIHCSSGTYIRSLARDIAIAAGSRAHIGALTRTQTAGFKIGNGEWGIGSRESGVGNQDHCQFLTREVNKLLLQTKIPTPYSLLPINKEVFRSLGVPWYDIDKNELPDVIHGKALETLLRGKTLVRDGLYSRPEKSGTAQAAAVFCNDSLAAVIEKDSDKWKYGYVYAHS